MTDNPFGMASESVGDGEGFRAADHLGRTVLFMGHKKDLFTGGDHGDTVVAHCDLILVLDTDEGVKAYPDALVFGAALAPTVYRNPMDVVLGVIGQGDAKPGKNPPWILEDPDESVVAAARTFYMEKVKESNGSYFYAPDEAPF